MKIIDYKPVEVSKSTIKDICAKYCVDERNEVYYMAYVSEPKNPISVLWADMNFLRRNYGVDKMNGKFSDDSKITKESLNISRQKNIDDMKLAIEMNVHTREIEDNWNGENFGEMDNRNYAMHDPETGLLDLRKKVLRNPEPLTKHYKEFLLKDIARGLYIICKYV